MILWTSLLFQKRRKLQDCEMVWMLYRHIVGNDYKKFTRYNVL